MSSDQAVRPSAGDGTDGTPQTRSVRFARRLLTAVMGLIAAGVALGVAEVVAIISGPTSSPVFAVGQGVIRITPEPVKEFAIRTFGENDKVALLAGTFALVVVFALVLGLVAAVRPVIGYVLLAVFGVVGVVAALTAPSASPLDVLPTVVGVVAGAVALRFMLAHLRVRRVSTGSTTAEGDETAPDLARDTSRGAPEEEEDRRAKPRVLLDRRGFAVAAGASVVVAAVGGSVGRVVLGKRYNVADARARIRLPAPASPAPALPAGTDLRLPGLTPFTTSNADFYRVDTALVLPQVNPESWELKIHGRVDNPMTLSFQDLLDRDLIERDITLTCVSNEVGGNLAGHARWLGAPLKALLEEVGVQDGADQIATTSSDGWTCGTPTDVVMRTENAMLAVAMNGKALPIAHGFPVRMIVPGLYGYVSGTKWIVDMELTSFDDFDPYWVKREWKAEAPIKVMSRIDTPKPFGDVKGGQRVKVAGVAWAQTRGITKVEVKADDGDWQEATLAKVPNNETWVQWVWDWQPSGSGTQTLTVRATDGDGTRQTDKRVTPFPDGATGWHNVAVNVT